MTANDATGEATADSEELAVEQGGTTGEAESHEDVGKKRPRRKTRLFPNMSFEEALFLGNAIQKHGSGQDVRRLTLFDTLQRSPDSGPTRKLITASNQYGVTTGGYSADVLGLTPKGRAATDPGGAALAKMRARIDLAILEVTPFAAIYAKYQGNRLPTVAVLRDAAIEASVEEADAAECVEIFLANARAVSLIKTIAGSEHLVSVDDALDGVEDHVPGEQDVVPDGQERDVDVNAIVVAPRPVSAAAKTGMDDVCFIISPIGSADSEERKHADLVLGSLIEPALRELGLTPIRADKISKPGLITGQVIDHLTRAKMVIADLSFGNPNVYYELALRHALRKPVVQITRSADKIPFDVGQFRTVVIDMSDIYTLVPQLELHRQEITRQCRAALDDGAVAENPLSHFYPSYWAYLPGTAK